MFADRVQGAFSLQETLSADATRAIARAEGAIRVESVDVFNASALATHATNYVTLQVINLGTDAQGTTVIATASTSQTTGAAMAANVAFPLTVTAAAADVAAGETLGFVYNEATTDVANNHVINVVVRYTQVGAP
jgi:hypothetical protein